MLFYFSILAVSVLSVLALGVLAAFISRYPRGWAALADDEIDHLVGMGVVSERVAKWLRDHEIGRFAKFSLGALFLVSVISTAIMLRGPE